MSAKVSIDGRITIRRQEGDIDLFYYLARLEDRIKQLETEIQSIKEEKGR